MSTFSYLDLRSRTQGRKARRQKVHVLFTKSRRNIAVTLDPDVVDRYGLVAGLDVARFFIEGDRVIITFARRGSAILE